jgi:hypothetical protein
MSSSVSGGRCGCNFAGGKPLENGIIEVCGSGGELIMGRIRVANRKENR